MTRIRKWIRFLFGFSGTEINGFLILLPLLFIVLFSQPAYRWIVNRDPQSFESDKIILDSLLAVWDNETDSLPGKPEMNPVKSALFEFDPNTATPKELGDLGLSKKLTARISNYRLKGGRFRIKSDLLKIYGVDSTLYKRLFAYIRLPERFISKTMPERTDKKVVSKFDLNQVDTVELKMIYGIGSRLARRIITYRQKLGGFIKTQQLTEVYGLDSAVLGRILERAYIIESHIPAKININQSTDRELSSHPYISMVIAKAIVAYRFQHGNFAAVEDIRNLQVLKKEDADKIIPYLSVNQ